VASLAVGCVHCKFDNFSLSHTKLYFLAVVAEHYKHRRFLLTISALDITVIWRCIDGSFPWNTFCPGFLALELSAC